MKHVPVIRQLRRAQIARHEAELAMMVNAILYNCAGSMASAIGGDGYSFGNSSIGWYDTRGYVVGGDLMNHANGMGVDDLAARMSRLEVEWKKDWPRGSHRNEQRTKRG